MQHNYILLTYYGDSASYYLNYLGCTDTFAFSIGQPSQILSDTAATHLSCYGDSSGAITTNASGGVGGYVYEWNPTQETTQNINDLIAGTYTVSITDAYGCEIVDTVIINEPLPMLLDIVVDMKFIFGDPIKPPTKRLFGLLYSSKGDPF